MPPCDVFEDSVDGIGTIRSSDSQDDSAHFGASSNIAFLLRITQALANSAGCGNSRDLLKPYHRCPSSATSSNVPGPEPGLSGALSWPKSCQATILDIPPDAMDIIQEYFATVALFMPFLHEESFIAVFERGRTQCFRNVRKSWLSLLYMILAHVYLTQTAMSPSTESAERSENFFQNALALAVPEVILGPTSLEHVQLFCSICAYLQGSSHSSRVWTFHGLAVKSALQLDLCSTESCSHLTPLDQEMRRRTWYMCLINDAIFSVKFGRPPLVAESLWKASTPSKITDLPPSVARSPSVMATSLSYYRAMLSLSFIIRDITKRLYYDNVGSPPPLSCAETLTETFNLSYKLSEWHGNVPRALRPGEGLEKQYTRHQPLETRRLQVALSFRYSGACILLHRPILQKLWDFNSDSTSLELTLLKGTGFLSLRSCMDTCRDAIQVGTSIVKEINRQTNLLGAWWFTTYYTFNASLMILGVLLASMEPSFNELLSLKATTSLHSSLNDAVTLLAQLDGGSPMIKQCRECLQRLLKIYYSIAQASITEDGSNKREQIEVDQLTSSCTSSGDIDLSWLPPKDSGSFTLGHGPGVTDTDLNLFEGLFSSNFEFLYG
ncbi:uncharacterized protein PV06_11769 [Exophiala oligosperma]|nr:uncharacterized protein PV06_11841 [Exophiala oligosperma]XP_016256111.1 uncharacterized protein PV06_11769 [Exophiala oligosperma]KIW35828.1 hypothetical protein PV06_11841 [Exophiala oligosperma]KIW35895.1 hypothetical protein PV06_11769 [Exophiala oligosperma]